MPNFVKYIRLISVLIMLIIGMVSCVPSPERRVLKAAESIMEENPDSALRLLNSIKKGSLSDISDRAKFNLLFCQANVKNNNVKTPIDSIKLSCDYYRRHGKKRELMKSLFYLAQLYFYNNSDFENALVCAMPAYDFAKELKDDYWIAKTSEELSDIYDQKMNQNKTLRFALEAADYYKKAGKEINVRYALVAAARAMLAGLNIDRGIQIFDSVLSIADRENDDGIRLQCQEGLTLACVVNRDFKNGLRHYAAMKNNPYYIYNYEDEVSYLYLQVYSGDTTGVKAQIEKFRKLCASDRERARLANLEYEAAKLANNQAEIVSSADALRRHTDGYLKDGIINSVSSEESNFYSSKAETKSEEKHEVLMTSGICLIVAVIITIAIVAIYRRRLKHRNDLIVIKQKDIDSLSSNLEENVDQNRTLAENLKAKDEIIARLNTMLDELSRSKAPEEVSVSYHNSKEAYRERWTLFNMLYEEYYRMLDIPASTSRKLKSFIDFASKIQSKEYLDKIRIAVDKYMGGIVSRLVEQCPWLKEDDILLLTLTYAGISPRVIAVIMDLQIRSMYNKRNRLKKAIIAHNPPDAAEFVDFPKPLDSE